MYLLFETLWHFKVLLVCICANGVLKFKQVKAKVFGAFWTNLQLQFSVYITSDYSMVGLLVKSWIMSPSNKLNFDIPTVELWRVCGV